MKRYTFNLVTVLLLYYSVSAFAQTPKFSFKHFTIDQGLSQNTVLSILADREGFIWIGTEDGLNKFDGYEFTTYRNDNKAEGSISNNQINVLHEDKNGNIWVGTAMGLNLYNRKQDKFIRIGNQPQTPNGPGEYITSLSEDSFGDIWIGTLGNLKKYESKTKKITTLSNMDGTLRRVQNIYLDKGFDLWLCKEKGFKIIDSRTMHPISPPDIIVRNERLMSSFIRTMKADRIGNIWIGTETNGVFIYNKSKNSLQNLRCIPGNNSSLPTNNSIRDIFIKNEDEVLIGTREGLSLYNISTGKFTNYSNDKYDQHSISHDIVRCITRDISNNCWIGTYSGGLNLITESSNKFSLITEAFGDKPGLSSKVVNAIANGDDGALWIGTESNGLNYVNKNRTSFKTFLLSDYFPNASNTVKTLMKDGKQLWIGTLDNLWCLDIKSSQFKRYSIPGNSSVYSLEKVGQDVWAGTNGAGVVLINKSGLVKQLTHDSRQNSIISDHINKLYRDKKGGLWIGSGAGLNYYDGKSFKLYVYDSNNDLSISNSSVLSLFIDSKDKIWIGTKGGGLNLFDPKKECFYHMTTRNGLSNDVIQDIREDKLGNIWLSSNKGLSKLSFRNFNLPFKKGDYVISNYYFEDGLQSNEFINSSSAINDTGELFFGGINGVSCFNPEQFFINKHKPPVVFTEFRINNKKVSIGDKDSPLTATINESEEITLSSDQAYFSIKFAALNYVNPNKNQYLYKLEGLNTREDWHQATVERIATYTNLDAGNYYFKVKASNNDGVWNANPKVLKIIVLPPWWKSWWAFILYAMIMAVLLYLYYYYSLKTAQLKNDLVYEHLIREKDQELYQQKLNFFTNISHEIKTPITLILSPLEKLLEYNTGNNKITNQLMMMKRNGERLMKLINQLLDFRKFDSGKMTPKVAEGNIIKFVKEVTYSFQNYAKNLGINLRVETEEAIVKLWFDRDMFEKILYNLISNSLKFTKKGGEVIIKLKKANDGTSFQMEIIDDGIGISEQHIGQIFDQFACFNEDGFNNYGNGIGLNFTKILVELHKGQISVESREGKNGVSGYTCFKITIPLGNSHFAKEEIVLKANNAEDVEAYRELQIIQDGYDVIDKKSGNSNHTIDIGRPILLIVEDNRDVLTFLSTSFEQKFQVYTAEDGKEGIDKAFELIPDIVVTDVMMPGLSGTQLCGALKKDSRTSHIPIILLTARTPVIYQMEGLEAGADDYILKPFSINILEARIWNLLDIRQKLRERYKKEITLQPLNIAISSPDEIFLGKIMKFIEENIANPKLSVEDLGSEVFMSRVTLYRKIKALTNQTPVEFIRGVRLKRAAQLLASQKHHISEVAYMVGFLDLNYFRRCFKEEFGKTPTEYGHADTSNSVT